MKAILARGSNADTTITIGIDLNKVHCSNIQIDTSPKMEWENWMKEQEMDGDIGPAVKLV